MYACDASVDNVCYMIFEIDASLMNDMKALPRRLLLMTDFHLDVDIAPSPVLIDLEELRIKLKVCVCVCVCVCACVCVCVCVY